VPELVETTVDGQVALLRLNRPQARNALSPQMMEETGLAAGLESERRHYELAMATEDRVEGMRAFLEKREPKFEGK
jgi:enoyl-CoA hydratase/carnithine racemase